MGWAGTEAAIFEVSPAAKVLTLTSEQDAGDLLTRFPATKARPYDDDAIDWQAVADAGFDAVRITFRPDTLSPMYGWETESTCWFDAAPLRLIEVVPVPALATVKLAHTPFQEGDLITFGKWQNKPGKIVRLFDDERGIPMIEIEPVPKGHRRNRTMGLYRIRHADPAKRVAASWLTAKTEPLDEHKVDTLRKEFLQLVNNVERVEDTATARRLRSAFLRWRELFEAFGAQIREDLNGRIRQYGADSAAGREAKAYLDHMAPFWELSWELRNYPPVADAAELHAEQPWVPEHLFKARVDESLEKGRKWLAKVKRKAAPAWKYLRDLVAWSERTLATGGAGGNHVPLVSPDLENVTLEGFQMTFRGWDEGGTNQEYLPTLRAMLRRYRLLARERLPLLLKLQLPMVVDWSWAGTAGRSEYAARYEHDHIDISPWGLTRDDKEGVRTLAHEMGHHLYRMYLSGDATKFWDHAVRDDRRDLDLRDALRTMESLGDNTTVVDKELAAADPILYLQLGTLLNDSTYKSLDLWNVRSIREYLETGNDPIVRVPASPITGYAGHNTEEAFADAIGVFVAYGPKRLPDAVLRWLHQVLGSQMRGE